MDHIVGNLTYTNQNMVNPNLPCPWVVAEDPAYVIRKYEVSIGTHRVQK